MTDYEMEMAFDMMGVRLKRPDHSGNRSGTCPLAQWTHGKGQDKNPSLTAKAGEPAVYRCWACRNEGTVFSLAKKYADHGADYRAVEYMKGMTKSTLWGRNIPYNNRYKAIGKKIQTQLDKDITEEKLKKWLELVPNYAFERGITKAQVMRWEIGFDQKESRMIFPIRDFTRKLMGVSGRDVTGKNKPKYRHYSGTKKEKVLYGECFIDKMNKRAYLVEGFMDVLALERHGYQNVLATMGTSVSDEQSKKLGRWFKEVIFIPDADDKGPGMEFVQVYGEKLSVQGIKVGIAGVKPNPDFLQRERPRQWEACDHRFLPIDLLKDKDPADLTKEQLSEVLNQVCWIKLGASLENRLFG